MNVADFLILMVEDEDDQVLLTQHALQRANLVNPVRIVTDGEQAIDYLSGKGAFGDRKANPLPSLILLDLKLPRVDGLEVLSWLREQPTLKTLPVAILTASINPRDRERADELGVTAYLCKPVDSEGLLEMMKSIGMYWMILRKTQEAQAAAAPAGARRTPHALIVDPDREYLSAISEGLRRRSPAILSDFTTDPEEALRLLAENAYDAVVVDQELAGPDDAAYLVKVREARKDIRTWILGSPEDPRPTPPDVQGMVLKRIRLRHFVDELHRALVAAGVDSASPAGEAPEVAEPAPTPEPRRGGSRHDTEILGRQVRFQKTSWDLVQTAETSEGMDQLIRLYWKPLYFFVRQKGFDNETSKDIVQGFLAEALERGTFAKADPARGKFRTFLLTALTNFMKDRHKASGRLKRGGGTSTLSLDFDCGERQYALEIASGDTPETTIDKSWAMRTLDRCMAELEGSPAHLRAFRMITEGACYAEVEKKTGLSETAAKTAVFRLRQQLREKVLRQITPSGRTVEDEELAMAEFVSFLQ